MTATGENERTTDDGEVAGFTVSRRLLSRHMVGSGVELGPGHVAFPLTEPGTMVRYVDRWQSAENSQLFPELAGVDFIAPDVVADLNTDRLRAFSDGSQDFVICSHVLEHVAEPIGLLADMHRILRPGGVLLILLPDRHRTFDRYRDGTPLAHLVAEFEDGVTEVDDEHVIDFAEKTGTPLGSSASERRTNIQLHAKRSVHVHCWDDEEFFSVLLYAVGQLSQRWEFIDGTLSDDEGPSGMEFGFVLRRCDTEVACSALHERLDRSWHLWRAARLSVLGEIGDLRASEVRLRDEVAALRSFQRQFNRFGPRTLVRVHRLFDRIGFRRRSTTSESRSSTTRLDAG